MGQATVALPDPLDLPPVDPNSVTPISAAALASADDLLSQLAGDDIDRLLAEAEHADLPPAAPAGPAEPPIDAAAAEQAELIRMVEQTVSEAANADAEAATAVAVPETIEQPATDPIAPENASALQSMIEPASVAIEPETAAPIAAAEPVHVASIEVLDGSVSEERHALVEDESPVAGPPTILVRILQFVNSPTAWLPDPVRDAVGKVGLLTMFNAVAVLGYVLLFRAKHPH